MEYYSKPEPATHDTLRLWETEFNLAIPSDYADFLLISNGPIIWDKQRNSEHQFLSIASAIEYYEAYYFKENCSNAIPICMDGNGNFAVYQVTGSGITGIYAMSSGNLGWDDSVKICDTVQELLNNRIEDILKGSI